MSKVISWLFLFIFIFQLFGYYAVFQIQKRSIKEEMFSMIKKGDIKFEMDYFMLTNAQYEKAKKDKNEIFWQNKMYDIVKVEKRDGMIKVFCINDKKEELLVANFHKLVKNTNTTESPKSNAAKNLLKILVLPFIDHFSETELCLFSSCPKAGCYMIGDYSYRHGRNLIPPQVS